MIVGDFFPALPWDHSTFRRVFEGLLALLWLGHFFSCSNDIVDDRNQKTSEATIGGINFLEAVPVDNNTAEITLDFSDVAIDDKYLVAVYSRRKEIHETEAILEKGEEISFTVELTGDLLSTIAPPIQSAAPSGPRDGSSDQSIDQSAASGSTGPTQGGSSEKYYSTNEEVSFIRPVGSLLYPTEKIKTRIKHQEQQFIIALDILDDEEVQDVGAINKEQLLKVVDTLKEIVFPRLRSILGPILEEEKAIQKISAEVPAQDNRVMIILSSSFGKDDGGCFINPDDYFESYKTNPDSNQQYLIYCGVPGHNGVDPLSNGNGFYRPLVKALVDLYFLSEKYMKQVKERPKANFARELPILIEGAVLLVYDRLGYFPLADKQEAVRAFFEPLSMPPSLRSKRFDPKSVDQVGFAYLFSSYLLERKGGADGRKRDLVEGDGLETFLKPWFHGEAGSDFPALESIFDTTIEELYDDFLAKVASGGLTSNKNDIFAIANDETTKETVGVAIRSNDPNGAIDLTDRITIDIKKLYNTVEYRRLMPFSARFFFCEGKSGQGTIVISGPRHAQLKAMTIRVR